MPPWSTTAEVPLGTEHSRPTHLPESPRPHQPDHPSVWQHRLGVFTAFSPPLVKWLNAFPSSQGPTHVFITESKISRKFWFDLSAHLCNFSCRNLPFIGTPKDTGNIPVV